jgi:hypothetical protein
VAESAVGVRRGRPRRQFIKRPLGSVSTRTDRQNSTYLLFCTRKYCNFATTNLLCAREEE